MRAVLIFVAFLFVGCASVGCTSAKSGCKTNGDCPGGQICHKAHCSDVYGNPVK